MKRAKSAVSVCSVEGCGGRAIARGWCWGHYQRWRRTGDPEAPRQLGQRANRGYSSISTDELALAVGATYKQILHWTTRGYLCPSIHVSTGRGDPARWSEADLNPAEALTLLRALMSDPAHLTGMAEAVREGRPFLLHGKRSVLVVGMARSSVAQEGPAGEVPPTGPSCGGDDLPAAVPATA